MQEENVKPDVWFLRERIGVEFVVLMKAGRKEGETAKVTRRWEFAAAKTRAELGAVRSTKNGLLKDRTGRAGKPDLCEVADQLPQLPPGRC
jgi:hypothetical protein